MQQLQLPPLADGEIYVGAIGDQQGILHHIILLSADSDDAPWQAQMDWAKSIGGDLPTRAEQALIWQNSRDQLKKDLYWSSETHASEPAYAWYQGFYYGNQLYHHKFYELRARAVRRLPI